jgi:tetratricopeptide (TPR) repeat protein
MTTNRGIEIAEEYLTFRKNEMAGTDVDLVILFGHLLYDMGEYNRSQKYFENLLAVRGSDANVYMGIGHALYIRCEYEEAIKNYRYAYDICDLSDFLLVARLLLWVTYPMH